MTFDERVQAVAKKGFTERQARFLTTAMLHTGVCVPRQYARFCGIVYGAKTRKFFAKLVRLQYASMYDCRHNRARIYHVNQRAMYGAIGEADSRFRKPVTLNHAIQRLMVLDAIVEDPDLVWLGTAEEKAAHLLALTRIAQVDLPHVSVGEGEARAVRYFPDRLPIGIHPAGRGVVVYVVTDPWLDEFRVFLIRHAALLHALPAWTLRIVVPPQFPDVGQRAKQAFWNQLLSPFKPEISTRCDGISSRPERIPRPLAARTWMSGSTAPGTLSQRLDSRHCTVCGNRRARLLSRPPGPTRLTKPLRPAPGVSRPLSSVTGTVISLPFYVAIIRQVARDHSRSDQDGRTMLPPERAPQKPRSPRRRRHKLFPDVRIIDRASTLAVQTASSAQPDYLLSVPTNWPNTSCNMRWTWGRAAPSG